MSGLMPTSVLVVCVGNICRSPAGEAVLRSLCPNLEVSSAGINALVGQGADEDAAATAERHGVSLADHIARQFTSKLGEEHALILAMEPGHRRVIGEQAPHLLGRTLLFDQWTGAKGIADPYRRSTAFHSEVFEQIRAAAQGWADRLQPKG